MFRYLSLNANALTVHVTLQYRAARLFCGRCTTTIKLCANTRGKKAPQSESSMQDENSVRPETRYLRLFSLLTNKTFEQEKRLILSWSNQHKQELHSENHEALSQLKQLELSENVKALVVTYCYADIHAGREYTTIFDMDNTRNSEPTKAVLRLGLLLSSVCSTYLAHGHHQIAVFDFVNGPPDLLKRLHPDRSDGGARKFTNLALCDCEHFEQIKKRLGSPRADFNEEP
jgi:hypothetical protein